MPAHPNWVPNPQFKKGEPIIAVGVTGFRSLTEGKEYICLNGMEQGVGQGEPYITVLGDKGSEVSVHAYRFAHKELPCLV